MVVSGSPKWYVYTANWGMDYATYHLLGEPETTVKQPLLIVFGYWNDATIHVC